jgi:hypothetical protein
MRDGGMQDGFQGYGDLGNGHGGTDGRNFSWGWAWRAWVALGGGFLGRLAGSYALCLFFFLFGLPLAREGCLFGISVEIAKCIRKLHECNIIYGKYLILFSY